MRKRILLVDDEYSILFAYKKVLQRSGLFVDAVESKEEAVSLLKENNYQAAILDLRLHGSEGEEGFELIRLIRDEYKKPEIKIIMITAYGSPEIRSKARQLGADFYFEKPVSTATIRSALESEGIDLQPNSGE